MKCDNSGIHQIISPTCCGKDATRGVTVHYHELERDVLNLCDDCARNLARDARRHGYKVEIRKL